MAKKKIKKSNAPKEKTRKATKKKLLKFEDKLIYKSLYRPFSSQWVYFDKNFNDMTYQMI